MARTCGREGKADEKQKLREAMRARRSALSGSERFEAARSAADHAAGLIGADFDGLVAVFFPHEDELDSLPLLHLLAERDIATALPVVERRCLPLRFHAWRAGEPLEKGAYGIEIPERRGLSLRPDVLIIPLLAFDRSGARLGYGGGFYDRTLEVLRAEGPVRAVGFAYAFQEVAALPAEPHDQRLDWVVTPAGAFRAEIRPEIR